jgi:hypothetical protein
MSTDWLDRLAEEQYEMNASKGFYDDPPTIPHLAGMVGTELSELIEFDRRGEKEEPSAKIPPFTNEEEEIADAILRLLSYAGWRRLAIGAAIVEKHCYNRSRPHGHGKAY